nr:MAG TPA: hypothetical protein [Bacteriophage sp.]
MNFHFQVFLSNPFIYGDCAISLSRVHQIPFLLIFKNVKITGTAVARIKMKFNSNYLDRY